MTVILDLLPALGFLMLNVFIPGPNVINTISSAMGSGRRAGISCALACGVVLFLWALAALLGAAAMFAAFPIAQMVMTTVGGLLLQYFAFRYIRKALAPVATFEMIEGMSSRQAFTQSFLIMLSNPKVLTTWLAVISLFPVVASGPAHIGSFTVLSMMASFGGHSLVATVFSTSSASRLYLRLYRPINGLVGVGFCFYGLKLLSGVIA